MLDAMASASKGVTSVRLSPIRAANVRSLTRVLVLILTSEEVVILNLKCLNNLIKICLCIDRTLVIFSSGAIEVDRDENVSLKLLQPYEKHQYFRRIGTVSFVSAAARWFCPALVDLGPNSG